MKKSFIKALSLGMASCMFALLVSVTLPQTNMLSMHKSAHNTRIIYMMDPPFHT